MNRRMEPGELKTHIKQFLREHREGSLATSMNNIPRSSPVQYFLGEDMDIYILSAGGEKFRAIKQNPQVCLLVNTEYINHRQIKGVQVFGHATTSLENEGLLEEAKKFYPDPYVIDHERNKLNVIKIEPTEIVYLDSLTHGDRTKQVLKNNEVMIKEDETLTIH